MFLSLMCCFWCNVLMAALCLQSSVHADSGAALPLVFRPPALLPISAPLVVASFLPHSNVKPALFWQFLLQSYSAGFNYANRNSSSEQGKKMSLKQLLLIAGTVSYATCAGALPQIFINRLGVRSAPIQTFFRSIVPIPLSGKIFSSVAKIILHHKSEYFILLVR